MVKRFYFLLLFLMIVMSIPNVYASNICTRTKFNDLKSKAIKIKAEWELRFDENDNYYFEVTLSNVDKDLMIKFNQVYYEPLDGKIKLNDKLEGGNTYNLQFYGGYQHSCVEQYIYTKKLAIPKYNKYSKMKECETYKEWELCDKWYSGLIIDENDFYYKLAEYKRKISSGEIVIKKDNKINPICISIVVLFVIIIGGFVCFSINKKSKKNKKTKKVGVKNEKV